MLDGVGPADPAVLPDLARRARDALAAGWTPPPRSTRGCRWALDRRAGRAGGPARRAREVPAAALARIAGLTTAADPAWTPGGCRWWRRSARRWPGWRRSGAHRADRGRGRRLAPVAAAPRATMADRRAGPAAGGPGRTRRRRPVPAATLRALGLAALHPGEAVAIGLVDGWSEAVRGTRQTTTAAFGFNAPAARPRRPSCWPCRPIRTPPGRPDGRVRGGRDTGRDPGAGARAGPAVRGPR